jgi:hypothetical protein
MAVTSFQSRQLHRSGQVCTPDSFSTSGADRGRAANGRPQRVIAHSRPTGVPVLLLAGAGFNRFGCEGSRCLLARIDKERGVRSAGLYVAIVAFVAVMLLVWGEFGQ